MRVRRAAYADAVLFSDAATFSVSSAAAAEKKGENEEEGGKSGLLLRHAQSYRINGHRVVMLRARHPPTAPPPSGNRCMTCGSGAADGHSACSVQCLISGLSSGRISSSPSSASAFLAEGNYSYNNDRNNNGRCHGGSPSTSRARARCSNTIHCCSSPANSSNNQNSNNNKDNPRDNGSSVGGRPPLPLAPQPPVTPPRTEARSTLRRTPPYPASLLFCDVPALGGSGRPPPLLVLSDSGSGGEAGGGGRNGNGGVRSREPSPSPSACCDLAQVQTHLTTIHLPPLAPASFVPFLQASSAANGGVSSSRKRPSAPVAGAAPVPPHLRSSPSPSPPTPPSPSPTALQPSRAFFARSASSTLSEADALNKDAAAGALGYQQQMQAQALQYQAPPRRGIPLYGKRRSASICSCLSQQGCCPSSSSAPALCLNRGGGATAMQQLLQLPVTMRPLNLRARGKKQGSPTRSALD